MPGLPVRFAGLPRRHRRHSVSDPQDEHFVIRTNRRVHRTVLPARCPHATGTGPYRGLIACAPKARAMSTPIIKRPVTLQEVAAESRAYAEFGYHLKDFLH